MSRAAYESLKKALGAAVPRISPRMRAVFVASCAERGFDLLERFGPVSIPTAERGIEVAWVWALGGEVPRDEHKWLHHQLSDQLQEVYANVAGYEQAAVKLVLDALSCLDDEERAATWAANALVSGAATCSDSNAKPAEYEWLLGALERCVGCGDAEAHRDLLIPPEAPPPMWVVEPLAEYEHEGDLSKAAQSLSRTRADRVDARRQRVAERRAQPWNRAWRRPSGIPERYEVRVVATGPGSHEGRVSTPGQEWVGVFEAGDLLFAPPHAVKLGMVPDESVLVSWRTERREGQSGIAREHYDWYVDRYAWPGRELLSSYRVQDREVIAWCWAVRLDVPLEGGGRLAVLRCRSEDWVDHVYVVSTGDETRETRDRNEALGWLEPP